MVASAQGSEVMKKVIRKRIRFDKDGVQVAGDVNAVISTEVRKRGRTQSVSSRQQVSIRQTSKKHSTDEPTDR
jgi:hypothetical protein